jgi:putative FmdB family regulatory protein
MPLYEYLCKNCRSVFEKLQGYLEAQQPTECPDCGSDSTERKVSGFSTGRNAASSKCGRSGFT